MASREQCEKALREKLKSPQNVKGFRKRWEGGCYMGNSWTDDQFVDENIKYILKDAQRDGWLDQLGVELDIPTDAEQQRVATEIASKAASDSVAHADEANKIARGARKWSWIAIAISLAALLWQIQNGCGLTGR